MSQALYRAVITQHLADATYAGDRRSECIERGEARTWLLEPNAGFAEVCVLAGLEPSAVRAYAIAYIAEREAKATARAVGAKDKHVTYQGRTWARHELARHIGMRLSMLVYRLDRMGLSVEEAVTRPSAHGRGRKALPIAA